MRIPVTEVIAVAIAVRTNAPSVGVQINERTHKVHVRISSEFGDRDLTFYSKTLRTPYILSLTLGILEEVGII